MTKRDEAYEIIRKLYVNPAIHWFQHRYEVMHKNPMTLAEMDEDVALNYAKGQHVILNGGFFLERSMFVCRYARRYQA